MADQEEDRRQALLLDVVWLRVPLRTSLAALAELGWDSDEELVTLTADDAGHLLRAYVDGSVSSDECEAWADALEARDDVGLDPVASDELRQFLFELSSPELFEPLTADVAHAWLHRLAR